MCLLGNFINSNSLSSKNFWCTYIFIYFVLTSSAHTTRSKSASTSAKPCIQLKEDHTIFCRMLMLELQFRMHQIYIRCIFGCKQPWPNNVLSCVNNMALMCVCMFVCGGGGCMHILESNLNRPRINTRATRHRERNCTMWMRSPHIVDSAFQYNDIY